MNLRSSMPAMRRVSGLSRTLPLVAALLVGLIAFGAGWVLFRESLTGAFVGIRAGILLVFLSAGLLLAALSLNAAQHFSCRYLVPAYMAALVWGYFYQAALVWDAPLGGGLIRSLFYAAVLVSLTVFVARRRFSAAHVLSFVCWLVANAFCLLGDVVPHEVMMLYLIGVVLPGLVALAVGAYFREDGSLPHFARATGWSVLAWIAGLLVLGIAAASVMGHQNLNALRNATDLNYALPVLFLAWPFLLWRFKRRPLFTRVLILGLITALGVISFSRTAFLLGIPLALVTLLRPRMILRGRMAVPALITAAACLLLIPAGISLVWTGRLGIASWSSPSSLSSTVLDPSGRLQIWGIALEAFSSSPLVGHGLGSFSTLMSSATGGAQAYSGAHSLLLTVLAERGLLAGAIVAGILLFIWLRLARLWWTETGARREFLFLSLLGYSFFVVAAHSLGAELLRAGTIFADSLVSVFLAVYLVIVTAWPRIRRNLSNHG